MAKAKKSTISVNGVEVTLITQEKGDYICLTDMVRNMEGNAIDYIRNWLRNGSTVEFLGVWEKVHNPNFKIEEFNEIKANYTRNSFLMSVKKWTGLTDAIGMEARKGRYGGTYAHSDIAVQFATWLSPEFYVYLVKEFQRFKVLEAQQNRDTLDWNLKRTLAKVNYRIHTDAVQKHLVPPRLTPKQRGIVYADEADLLNVALFGMTAKMWRTQNPDKKGNIRDHATGDQLLVLSNLENLNAEYINMGLEQENRLERLNEIAIYQMKVLTIPDFIKKLPKGK